MNTAAAEGWTVSGVLRQRGATDEQHKLSARELCQMLGVSNRKLGLLIEDERAAGMPICSTLRSGGGYYLPPRTPEGAEAVRECCEALRNRADRMRRTAESLSACAGMEVANL